MTEVPFLHGQRVQVREQGAALWFGEVRACVPQPARGVWLVEVRRADDGMTYFVDADRVEVPS